MNCVILAYFNKTSLRFVPNCSEETKPVQVEEGSIREERKAPLIPFVVQPGFQAPMGQGRVLMSFGTSTITSTTTFTSTTSLVAICRSSTSFQLCGSTGK